MDALFPYQEVGARALADSSEVYLADEPGLGKSAQVATACDYVGADRVLIISPASLKVNWAREMAKFSLSDLPVQIPSSRDPLLSGSCVTIINYDLIIKKQVYQKILDTSFDVIVFDEAHALKSRESQRTKAALGKAGIVDVADMVWMVSGTPIPNHPGELYPVLHRLYPEAIKGMSYDKFIRHYCYVVEGLYGDKIVGNKPNISELKHSIKNFMLRRLRSEVLPDLPDLVIGSLTVESEIAARSLRKALDQFPEIAELIDQDLPDDEILDWIDDMQMATLRKLCGVAKAPVVADQVSDELDAGMEQIVLMCWHHDTMDILSEKLTKYGVARVDGKVPSGKRQDEVDRFNNHGYTTPCRVFIGQIQAAGVGHTMTSAHDMLIVEPSWVPGENVQAMLRIHRIGQHNKCLVRFATLAGSIDDAIMSSAERKSRMIAELLI